MNENRERGRTFHSKVEGLPRELEGIITEAYLDPGMTFRIESENDEKGNTINADVFWARMRDKRRMAEGKLWLPKNVERKKLIIFEPGMPGDSATWMEERHVKGLTENGYAIMVLRHLGTRTDVEGSARYVHSAERMERGAQEGKSFIGEDREYDVEEAAHEVGVAANALGDQFDEISLMGHSSGVLNSIYSFKDIDPEIQKKIGRVIGLSGFVDRDRVTEFFRSENVGGLEGYYRYCAQYLRLGDVKANVQAAHSMFDEIEARGKDAIPHHTAMIQYHTPNDEFLRLEGAKKFQESILGRGTLIRDDAQFTGEIHGLEDLETSQLLRLLESSHLPGVKITERLTRSERRRQELKDI